MSLADDPRLTAYADGALPARDSRRLARALADDPEARAELEELRELQRGLREAFAGVPPPVPGKTSERPRGAKRPAVSAVSGTRRAGWIGSLFVAVGIVIVGATLASTGGKVSEAPDRADAMASLRQIGQACLVYASANGEKTPGASDLWEFARLLAREGGLNDATRWTIETDPAAKDDDDVSTVLAEDGKTLHPEFAASKPAYAVVLGGLSTAAPPTTPVAWTRGLRPDGTWAPDSPFGQKGGHVMFLSGEVRFFREGRLELVGRDGRITKDIRDALPEGMRVGEYVPTAAESRLWSEQARPLPGAVRRVQAARWAFGSVALLVFAGTGVWQIVRGRLRAGDLLMAGLVSILLLLLGAGMH